VLTLLICLVLAGGLSACNFGGSNAAKAPQPSPAAKTSPNYSLITEPDAGIAPVDAFMESATKSLDMEMYELVDSQAELILAGAAAHGVDVRVVMDQNRERAANQATFAYLSAHGVHVVWAPSSFDATHAKFIVVDSSRALVMTLNLTSRYYASTRDFAVADSDAADVAAIEATFAGDFAGDPVTPAGGSDLVWSPTTSSATLVGLINSAKTSLQVENEEMSNADVIDALTSAAQRGVTVDVTMTDSTEWTPAFDQLSTAGVHVATYAADASLYIHAKVIVADSGTSGAEAFVGSQNFTTASLNYNRELGLVTNNTAVIGGLAQTLNSDFAAATPWPG
jgi:phosphatidylserine/phosphatidylglycerophosphate/cardiolipin synthase-like enzyme